MWFKKASPRRQAIREDVAEAEGSVYLFHGFSGPLLLIAALFFLVAALVQYWPADPLPYREGEKAPIDLRAPVSFTMVDKEATAREQEWIRANSPPVLTMNKSLHELILAQIGNLKGDLQGVPSIAQVPTIIAGRFPGLTNASLASLHDIDPTTFTAQVKSFLERRLFSIPLITPEDRAVLEDKRARQVAVDYDPAQSPALRYFSISQVHVLTNDGPDAEGRGAIENAVAESFSRPLVAPITNYIFSLRESTFRYDGKLTAALADRSASAVTPSRPPIQKGEILVARHEVITPQKFHMLEEAQQEFLRDVATRRPWAPWLSRIGRLTLVLIITAAGAFYIVRMTKVAKSLRHAWAVSGLLVLTLVLAKLIVSIAPDTLYFMGVAPTLLATIILAIAFNQRFSLGVGALHALLVTITLGQGIDFFLPLLSGIAVFSFGLTEIRTRGKLMEIGALASAVIFGTVWATGFARMIGDWGGGVWSPWTAATDTQWFGVQSLWAVASGITAAATALVCLGRIERLFSITTAMTLLEWADASKPLLRRLSQEAAGTFNHSLTVGIMAEAAGNAVGANGLLCRVGAYYHDVGKLSKPQYFIENQAAGHPNRHDKLSPAMSLLIIVGHVKDGIELAREYNLPWLVHQFIAQHHGTTLVEYFFHAARKRAEQVEDSAHVSDTEFRYPGPKPQTREAAIIMICDGCESAVRAIEEPTAGRIESTVHNMIMKRLMDGQFAECDLTLRDLSIIEETLVRTLAAIHHGRVAYPSSESENRLSDIGPLSQPA